MSYLWPQALWLLLAVPALVAMYVVMLRRRNKAAIRYASIALVRDAMPRGQRLRRHLPPLLFLLALIALILSLATLFPNEGIEQELDSYGANRDRTRAAPIDRPRNVEKKEFKPVPPGSYRSGAIILLTDGRRTIGPDPLDAARLAADR